MRWLPALALVPAVLLGACIPVPPHHSPFSRGNVPREVPGWLEPGKATLAEVFFRLGEPDDVSLDERTMGWVNINRLGGGLLLFAAGSGGAGGAVVAERYRRLVVQFDGNGIVVARRIESATCTSGMWGVGTAGSTWGDGCLPPLPESQPPTGRRRATQ